MWKPRSSPLWRFVLVAAVMHAGAVGLASLVVHRHILDVTPSVSLASQPGSEVEVTVVEATRLAAASRSHSSADRSPRGARPEGLRSTSYPPWQSAPGRSRERSASGAGTGDTNVAAVKNDDSAVGGPTPGGLRGPEHQPSAGLTLEQLGISLDGSRSVILDGQIPPREVPEPGADLQHSMISAIEMRDRLHGLGPHGPILAALENATRIEVTSVAARAEFLALVDERGRVASVEAASATREFRAWRRAARRAQRTILKRRFHLPAGAKGLELRLEVSSRAELPSGGAPGDPMSLGFDVADIGAHTQRVIRGRVLAVRVL